MNTSKVYIQDMKPIDGSDVRYYHIIINDKMVTYKTGGSPTFYPHITKEEFKKRAIEEYKEFHSLTQ